MRETAQSPRPNVLPLIRYREPARSIEWLCGVLGFEKHHVALRDDGSIAYAHLRFGGSLIMVTPAGDATGRPALDAVSAGDNALITLPAEIEPSETQSCCFVVDDIETHYRNAKEAGADIVLEIKIYEHGGCRYSCRDPEGHNWNFCTYDPWREHNIPASQAFPSLVRRAAMLAGPTSSDLRLALPVTVGVLTVMAGCGLALWLSGSLSSNAPFALTQAVAARDQAEAQLTEERVVRQTSERALLEAQKKLSKEQVARQTAESSVSALRKQLAQEAAKLNEHSESDSKLAEERTARLAAEQAALKAQEELGRARAEATTLAERPTPIAHSAPVQEPKAAVEETPGKVESTGKPPSEQSSSGSEAQQHQEPASPLLAEGRALMAKGDIEGARRAFLRAADGGLPEGALALGSTYDPASLARYGLTGASADAESAKRWYRRAHELTQAAALKTKPVNHE